MIAIGHEAHHARRIAGGQIEEGDEFAGPVNLGLSDLDPIDKYENRTRAGRATRDQGLAIRGNPNDVEGRGFTRGAVVANAVLRLCCHGLGLNGRLVHCAVGLCKRRFRLGCDNRLGGFDVGNGCVLHSLRNGGGWLGRDRDIRGRGIDSVRGKQRPAGIDRQHDSAHCGGPAQNDARPAIGQREFAHLTPSVRDGTAICHSRS